LIGIFPNPLSIGEGGELRERRTTGGVGDGGVEEDEWRRVKEKRVERAWKNERIELKVFPLSTFVFITQKIHSIYTRSTVLLPSGVSAPGLPASHSQGRREVANGLIQSVGSQVRWAITEQIPCCRSASTAVFCWRLSGSMRSPSGPRSGHARELARPCGAAAETHRRQARARGARLARDEVASHVCPGLS